MAGFIIFLPATVPSPDQYQVIEKGYSFKISDLSVPKGITHNYRFFESILPSHRFAELSRGRALADRFPHLARVWFGSQSHMCSQAIGKRLPWGERWKLAVEGRLMVNLP